MNICVCIKQVPGAFSVADTSTGGILRDKCERVLNPPDKAALEAAFVLRERYGGTVCALTMGPLFADAVVEGALSLGADSAYLLTDKAFIGSDVYASSYALCGAIETIGGADIIICGAYTTDGGTGQLPAALAAWMRLPYLSGVSGFDSVRDGNITVRSVAENSENTVELSIPCVFSVEPDAFALRMPNIRTKLLARNKKIGILDIGSLPDAEPEHYGLAGSRTRVAGSETVKRTPGRSVVDTDAAEASRLILDAIRERMII